jgi:hypothetical protein
MVKEGSGGGCREYSTQVEQLALKTDQSKK